MWIKSYLKGYIFIITSELIICRFIPYLLKISNYEYIDTEICDRPRIWSIIIIY